MSLLTGTVGFYLFQSQLGSIKSRAWGRACSICRSLGKTPQQRLEEVADQVPTADEVHKRYDPKNEMWQTNWKCTWVFAEGKGVILTKASR